jgi:hypothetical protein
MTRSFSLSLTKSFPSNKKTTTPIFSALEKQIDVVVYKLYGLANDEIAIVEGKQTKGYLTSEIFCGNFR